MADRIIIAELDLNTKAMQDANTKLIKDIQKLKAEQKELYKETNNLQDATDEQARAFIENDAALKNLQAQYNNNKKIISENITGVQGLNAAIDREVQSVNEARKNNAELLSLRNQINTATAEGAAVIEEINKKIDENTNYIKANVSEMEQQKMSIGDYSNQIKDAFADLNIFNGGIGGFISRAQAAGGAGNLLKNSFSQISTGIMGATKSALAFIATPIGAVIAAITVVVGILYSVFKNFTPILDKVEQGFAAVSAVVNVLINSVIGLVTGAKSLSETFSGLGSSMKDAAIAAAELKKAQQDLEDNMEGQAIQNTKIQGQIEALIIQSKDRTKSEEQRLAALKKAGDLEKQNYSENLKLAKQGLDNDLKVIQQKAGITNKEVNELRKRYQNERDFYNALKELAEERGQNQDEEFKNFQGSMNKYYEVYNQHNKFLEKNVNANNKIVEKAEADREKAEADAEKKREEAKKKAEEAQKKREDAEKKRQDAEIKRMNDELNIFITKESKKKKTIEESLAFEDTIMQKRLAILDKEKQFGKKTVTEYEADKLQIEAESARKKAELAVKNLQEEAALYLAQNQSRLDGAKTLTDLLVEEERNRQQKIFNNNLEIINKQHEAGLTSETEYLTQKLNLQNDFNKQKQDLDTKYEEQKRAEKLLIDQTNYDADVITMEERNASQFELELARIAFEEQTKIEELEAIQGSIMQQKLLDEQARRDAGLISETQYQANRLAIIATYENQIRNIQRSSAVSQDKVRVAAQQAQLSGAANVAVGMAQIAGEQSAVGKAAAVAQATINTYQGASLALATYPPPFSYIAVAATIAAGIAQVAKIAGVKGAEGVAGGLSSVASGIGQVGAAQLPKAEKGAAFTIGGKRHSQGGTKFYGEDGTAFEAEQGEVLAVVNRNASKVLMDFNNKFSSGTSGVSRRNYFADGGIVARQNYSQSSSMDINLLAAKIGQNVGGVVLGAVANLPNPVVAVTDINDGQSSYAQVVNGANIF